MSNRRDGGGGGEFFLSSHRCPEVDLLPHHNSKTHIPPPCSPVPAEKSSEFTCMDQSEANYLDISTCCSEEEEEEEEGSISDWSEEDLSLHFSPSVILPSDEEESDPESGFECIDVSMDTLVKGQDTGGLKMVPKRLIQLKKKKDAENIIHQENAEKRQVILKEAPAEGGGANIEVSANELLCPTARRRPDLLLRQHSVPASFHTRLTTSSEVDGNRVYRGLVAGASQGFQTGVNSAPRQRLQKSFSLDETKTKMASCIIKSVLSKKMQVEQNNSKTSHLQKKCFSQPADQQRVRQGGGGEDSCPAGKTGGVIKAPVHVVRDMRSLVKNTYSLSFCTAQPTPDNKTTSFKVIGQQDSPPPTYQQAVGVKGHDESKRSCPASVCTSKGHVTKVAASLSKSQDRAHTARFSCPITQQRRGSEPIISRTEGDDVTWPVVLLDPPTKPPPSADLTELSKPERGRDVSHQAGTSLPSPHPPSTPRHPEGTQLPLSAQEQSPILGVSSKPAPSSSQQVIHPCFYNPTVLPAFLPTMHPHLGKISYVHGPLSYIQTQLQLAPPVPTLHLLRRSEENQLTGNFSVHPNNFIRTCPPQQTRTAGDKESNDSTVTAATQEQQEQYQQHEQQTLPQQLLCSAQGFLPAQVGSDFLVDITGSVAASGALLSGPAPCHMMLDPKSGRYLYVETPPRPQRKMLLDPETGQYIQVFLPAARAAPNTGVFQVRSANSTPMAINPAPAAVNPAVLSVMQFQPTVAVPSMYAPSCLPFSLHTPTVNFTRTAP